MLLDRKRINFWARWTAIFLAIVFALGTVLLGVGSSTGNVLAGCEGSVQQSVYPDKEQGLKDRLQQNPADTAAMIELGDYYVLEKGQHAAAVPYYDEYLKLVPGDKVIMEKKMIASFNVGHPQITAGDFTQGAISLQTTIDTADQIITINPDNANAYFYRGHAANDLGQKDAAIAAFNRFLEIAPGDFRANSVQKEINKLTAPPATVVPPSPAQ